MDDLRQQWEEIDFDAVGLWRHLLRDDYRKAAVGLLQDLLKELHDTEDPTNDDPDLVCQMPDGTPVRTYLVAERRERLMQMLGETDDRLLKHWQHLYRQYRYEAVNHEFDAIARSEFLQSAMRLVVKTGEERKEEE